MAGRKTQRRRSSIQPLAVILAGLLLGLGLQACDPHELGGQRPASLIRVADNAERAGSVPLRGAALADPAYVFLPSSIGGVSPAQVEWFVDDPDMSDPAYYIDTAAPFNLVESAGAAQSWSPTAGLHEVTARWTYPSSTVGANTAVFTSVIPPPTTTTTTSTTTTSTTAPTTTTTVPAGFTLTRAWFQANTGPLSPPTKTRSGSFTSADAGKTFDGYTFSSGIQANGVDNVTITNSIVRGRVAMGYGDATGWRFEQCELDGTSISDDQSQIGDVGIDLYRCNIHGGSSGVRFQGAGTRVVETWIHDLTIRDPAAHRSGIGSNGPTSDTELLRNWVEPGEWDGLSASLALYGDFGKVTDVLVEGNLFNGSGSFTTYAGSCSAKPYPLASGVRYLGNTFGPDMQYGHRSCWDANGGLNVWTGNVDQNGQPVS